MPGKEELSPAETTALGGGEGEGPSATSLFFSTKRQGCTKIEMTHAAERRGGKGKRRLTLALLLAVSPDLRGMIPLAHLRRGGKGGEKFSACFCFVRRGIAALLATNHSLRREERERKGGE